MLRHTMVAAGTLIGLAALPLAPAAAADGDQIVLTQSGQLRCLVSADNVPRGGGPMVVCAHADGTPWAKTIPATNMNSAPLTVAVKLEGGQFYWATGTATDPNAPAAPSDQGTAVSPGQSVHINGWTITDEPMRTRIENDFTGRGYYINYAEVVQF